MIKKTTKKMPAARGNDFAPAYNKAKKMAKKSKKCK
jgi:hypothetical protein